MAKNIEPLLISDFPASTHATLRALDDEGDGKIETDELVQALMGYAEMKKAAKDGSIALSQLPAAMRPSLSVFDVDGDGTIAPMELARAAELYQESKHAVKRLAQASAVVGTIVVILLAAICTLTAFIVEEGKETTTDPDTGVTFAKGSDTVQSVGEAVSTYTLAEAVQYENSELDSLNHFVLSSIGATEADDHMVSVSVAGWMRDDTVDQVTFYSHNGHTITVDAAENIDARDRDGNDLLEVSAEKGQAGRRHLLRRGGRSCSASSTGTVRTPANRAGND